MLRNLPLRPFLSSTYKSTRYASLNSQPLSSKFPTSLNRSYRGLLYYGTLTTLAASTTPYLSHSESKIVNNRYRVQEPTTKLLPKSKGLLSRLKHLLSSIKRAITLTLRTLYLLSISTTLATLYLPLTYTGNKKTWLSLCVYGVEVSGAAVVKLFQWASSRPDMFGERFCNLFKKLQDETRPHSFRHTKKLMTEAFGPNWSSSLGINLTSTSQILGSGCIGQVYKGERENGEFVAVKILHPNVGSGIDADLDILRVVASLLDRYDERVKWLNFPGMVEEFSELLKDQLDLNNEARNLLMFRENFKGSQDVIFPELVMSHQNVMIMEFVDGDTVWEFVERHSDDQQLLNRVCNKGITAVCQMIFEHNFVHGDVHPGNILFSRDEDPKLVLLDTGIAKKFTRRDHKLLIDVLGGFIQGDGASAGRAIIADSVNRTSIPSHNEDGFVMILDDMCEKAKADHSFFDSIGNYVTIICDGASKHKIMMNQGFVSIALTTRVMEGVALALNPAAEIWRIANKIVMKVKAEEMLGTAASQKRFEDEDEELRKNTFTRRGTKKVSSTTAK